MSRPSSREGSKTPVERDSESESENERSRSVSPAALLIEEECYKSPNAIFIKRWERGLNSCSRTDLEFGIEPSSTWSAKREERLTRPPKASGHVSLNKGSSSSKSKDAKRSDSRRDDRSHSPVVKKKFSGDTPRSTPSVCHADSQPIISTGWPQSFPFPGLPASLPYPYPLDHPALRGGMYSMIHDPTPALRQLSEYAKPHIGSGSSGPSAQDLYRIGTSSQDPYRTGGGLLSSLAASHPYAKLAGAASSNSTPGSRDRAESESERQRSDAFRVKESWDVKDKIKHEVDLKPALDGVANTVSAGNGAAAGLSAESQLAAELQRRYLAAGLFAGQQPTAPPFFSGLLYQPPSGGLAADWLNRERLEMFGMRPGLFAEHAERIAAERMHAERLAAERLNVERLQAVERLSGSGAPRDPLYRVEAPPTSLPSTGGPAGLLGIATSTAAEQAHTHTHSHTHLHLHQPDAATVNPLFPPTLHPMLAPHMLPGGGSSFGLPESAAGGSGSSAALAAAALQQTSIMGGGVASSPAAAYSLAASQQLMAAAQEQEMIFRELLCRPPYNSDPVLAQQLMLQQEAVHRQFAMERDRLLAMLPR